MIIRNKIIGPGNPCFIIAEAGVNHNGDISLARKLIDAAVASGADAVKFQTFKAENLATLHAPKASYQKKTTSGNESQFEMLKRLELSRDDHYSLKEYCERKKILFLSTPFDEESADLLDQLGVPLFKIPSGEITNLPFLEHLANKRRPLILSTGMSTLEEVGTAVRIIHHAGNREIILLHCVSRYPANPDEVNLKAMLTMSDEFGVPVGYSDHTMGIDVAIAAVALGACVIEKHFTLNRNLPGPDHKASLEPQELFDLVNKIRLVESALGHGRKEPSPSESETAAVARKSLVAMQDLVSGTTLQKEHISAKRPGTGLPPSLMTEVIGKKLLVDIAKGTLLQWKMFR